MLGTWKYMLFLALALPAIYAYAPSLEGVAKLRWLDDIGVFITKSLAPARPEANASAVDPVAAANLDEDLDYRNRSADEVDRGMALVPDRSSGRPPRAICPASSTSWFRRRRLPRRRLSRLRMSGRQTPRL